MELCGGVDGFVGAGDGDGIAVGVALSEGDGDAGIEGDGPVDEIGCGAGAFGSADGEAEAELCPLPPSAQPVSRVGRTAAASIRPVSRCLRRMFRCTSPPVAALPPAEEYPAGGCAGREPGRRQRAGGRPAADARRTGFHYSRMCAK
jgi:hypothetical protein